MTADYRNKKHAAAIVKLLSACALDPMGGGEALDPAAVGTVVGELAKRSPAAFTMLAFVDGQPAGLLNCFESFSALVAKPFVHIHECYVAETFRRRGISNRMLAACECIARMRGCWKISLEVLEGNHAAQASYTRFGFHCETTTPSLGKAICWQKTL